MNEKIKALLQLSHEIGSEERPLAILGGSNTSVKLSNERFAVKASGCSLATLAEPDVTTCDTAAIRSILDSRQLTEEELEGQLLDARIGGAGKKPSIESMFHAWLLTLRDVNYVGHCHPLSANQVLRSPCARDSRERGQRFARITQRTSIP